MNFFAITFKNKNYFEKYYECTAGYYPFFQNCPKKYYEYFLKKRYNDVLGYIPDFKTPKTYNEKIRWLLFHGNTELHTKLSDKIAVKDWVKSKLGEDFVSPIYSFGEHFEDIDFNSLPDKFALKLNHSWKMNLFISNKKTFLEKHYNKTKKEIRKWLDTNYYYYSLEPQYKNIKPMVFAEELRINESNNIRDDIMVHCINGNPELIEIFIPEYRYTIFYNTNWEIQPFTHSSKCLRNNIKIPQPKNLDDLLNTAQTLAQEFTYVRVDFANSKKIILGEMSFSPHAAMIPFFPNSYDEILGDLIKLPENTKKVKKYY